MARTSIVFPVEVHPSALRAKDGGAHGFALPLLGTDRPRQATVIEAVWAANLGAHRPGAPRPPGMSAHGGRWVR